jgi:hypothetical protein
VYLTIDALPDVNGKRGLSLGEVIEEQATRTTTTKYGS